MMNRNIHYGTLLLASVFLQLAAGISETSVYYRRDVRYDNVLPTENTVQISKPITVSHCTALCTQMSTCRSVFFKDNVCTLYNWNLHFYITTVPKAGVKCYEKSGPTGDLAKGKPTQLSTVYDNLLPSVTVNSVRKPYLDGPFRLCCHSKDQRNPYYIVDLQVSFKIVAVVLLNRYNRAWNNLENIDVMVGQTSSPTEQCSYTGNTSNAGELVRIPCLTRPKARYVKLIKYTPNGVICVCSVEVYGIPL